MHIKVGVIALALAFFVGLPFAGSAGPAVDTDGDTIPDARDNCIDQPNPGQADDDTPPDGYGDLCDSDYDNDGGAGILDVSLWLVGNFGSAILSSGGTAHPSMDQDGDTGVGILDISLFFVGNFGSAPGPSGLPCATIPPTIPCEC